MEKGSGADVNSEGRLLKSILKKSTSLPLNKAAAAVSNAGNMTAGSKPFAVVVHGSNRPNIDGKYKVRSKVSMNATTTVLEVDETDFASPNRGANMEDGVMQDVGNSANDDIDHNVHIEGHHTENVQQVGGNSTQMASSKPMADVNVSGVDAGGCGEVRSSKPDDIRPMGSNTTKSTKDVDEGIYVDTNTGTKPDRSIRVAANVVKGRYDNSLAGFFVGKYLAFPVVQNYVINTWSKFGFQKLMRSDDGVFLFKFLSKYGMEQVLGRGPWMIRKSRIILNKRSSSLSLKKGEVTKVPVWVKMHNVQLLAYSEDGMSLIATQIGKPIMLDAFTSSMCVESWGRIGFARALIEISSDSDLKKEVIIAIPNEEGNGYMKEVIRVEYE
ncbi:reverse transcriptase domain-containing protein [Tanacetum coccineum]